MISWYVKLTCTIEELAVKYFQCNRCHEPKSKSSKTIRIRKFSEHEENTELKDTGITCLAHSWRPVLLRWFCTNTTPLKSTTKYYTISYRGSETFGKLNVKLLQHFFMSYLFQPWIWKILVQSLHFCNRKQHRQPTAKNVNSTLSILS